MALIPLLSALQPWMYSLFWGLLSLLIMGSNLMCLWHIYRFHERSSMVLVLGGAFGTLACLSAPWTPLRYLVWVPWLLDPISWNLLLEIKERLSKQ